MTKQSLKSVDVVGINMMLAHVRCISELIHTLPEHKYEFKAYFKELFTVVKKYEKALDKMTDYNATDGAFQQQQDIYDNLMEVTYEIRKIVLEKADNGNTTDGTRD
jgi:hypothetical protein